jgi:hypothetical protein
MANMRNARHRLTFAILSASSLVILHAQQRAPTAIKAPGVSVAFAHPPDRAPSFSGYLPPEAFCPPDKNSPRRPGVLISFCTIDDPHEQGPLAKVAHDISAVRVTWSDPARFKTEAQTEELLREILSSPSTITWTFQIWQQANPRPSVMANVEHRTGKQGRLVVWCDWGLHWVYQDGNDNWWWGAWGGPEPPSVGTVPK